MQVRDIPHSPAFCIWVGLFATGTMNKCAKFGEDNQKDGGVFFYRILVAIVITAAHARKSGVMFLKKKS